MDTTILGVLSQLAPDLMAEMELRALILERIAALEQSAQVEVLRCDVTSVIATYRVFSPLYGRALSVDVEPVTCSVPLKAIPEPGFQRVRIVARPVNSFGRKGEPIRLDCTPELYRKFHEAK